MIAKKLFRWAWIVLLAAVLLALAAMVAAWFLLRVPAVQDRLVEEINRRIADVGPYPVRIEGMRGRPPLNLTLDRVTVSDAEGVWLDARGIRLRLHGRSGLSGRLRFREISAAEVGMLRTPEPAPEAAPRDPGEPADPGLLPFVSIDRLAVPLLRLAPGVPGVPGKEAVDLHLVADARLTPIDGLSAVVRLRRDDPSPTRLQGRVQWTGTGTPIRAWANIEEAAGGWLGTAWPWPMGGGFRVEAEASLRADYAHGDVVFHSAALGRGRLTWRAERTAAWEVEADLRTRGLAHGPVRIDIPRLTLRAQLDPGHERLHFEGAVRDRVSRASLRGEAYRTPDRVGLRDLLVESGPVALRGAVSRTFETGLFEGRLEAEGLDPETLPFLRTFLPQGLPEAWAATGEADIAVEAAAKDGRQRIRIDIGVHQPATAWARAAAVDLQVDAVGPWDLPEVKATLDLRSVEVEALAAVLPGGWHRIRTEAHLRQGRLEIATEASMPGVEGRLRLACAVATDWLRGERPDPMRHPLELALDVQMLTEALPEGVAPGTENLRGRIGLNLSGRGTLERPTIEGRFEWTDGGIVLPVLGARLSGVHLVLVGAGNTLRIEEARATDGDGGRLTAHGEVYLPTLHALPQVTVSVESTEMRLLDLPYASARVGGTLALEPAGEGAHRLTGALSTRDAEIRIPSRLPPSIPRVRIVERGAPPPPPPGEARTHPWLAGVDLDVGLRVSRMTVRGRGLESEWSGSLQAQGSAAALHAVGTISAVRGRLQFLGRRFRIEEARLDWRGPVAEPPTFLCRATARAGGIRAWVEAQGTVAAPVITLRSDPPGPEDEVLARVLFGRGLDRLSPFQAVRLAHGLRVLRGEGDTFDVLAHGQQILQVDQIDIVQDEDEEGIGAVSVGKYVGDYLYIEGAKGLGGTHDRFSAELELTPSITLETEASPGLREGIRLRWSRDY